MAGTIWRDACYAARSLLRDPGFAAFVILTLAVGIGASTVVFTVVNAVLLKPLPYAAPGELVIFSMENVEHGFEGLSLPPGAVERFKSGSHALSEIASWSGEHVTLTGGDEPRRVHGARAESGLFSLLGAEAAFGRVLLPEDEGEAGEDVVVLSHGLWKGAFGGDPDILGRGLVLDGKRHAVVGVMDPAFRFPTSETELWVPLRLGPDSAPWSEWILDAVARLDDGVTISQAQAEIDLIYRNFVDRLPFGNGWRFTLKPLRETIVGDVRPALLALSGAVCLVVLIVCANVANLLLARGTVRRRELAVRGALGASRSRIVAQLQTETLVVAAVGGALGLLLAQWGIGALGALLPDDFPRLEEMRLDWAVLGFGACASLFTGALAGALPALRSSGRSLSDCLKSGGGGPGRGGPDSALTRLLVVCEVALSIVLIVGSGLLIRSFVGLMRVDSGFDPENVVTMRLTLPESRYQDSVNWASFGRELLERSSTLPGVDAVGLTTGLPTRGARWMSSSLTIEGRDPGGVEHQVEIWEHAITPDYLRAAGIRLLRGRSFLEGDSDMSRKVVLIGEGIARRFFPGQDPIGRRILNSRDEEWMTVVGVVTGTRHDGLDRPAPLQIYMPFDQAPHTSFYLAVRTRDEPGRKIHELKSLIWSLDPHLAFTRIETLEEAVAASVAHRRFNASLMSAFGLVALLLAMVGIYGVVAFSVSRRMHEVGVRLAMGARPGDILRQILVQGMRSTLLGVALGLAGALALTRFVESLLFGVTPTDPISFAGGASLMIGVAFLAVLIPALRASRMDPVSALRYE